MLITIRAIVDSILTVDLISLLYFKYALTMDLISLLQQLALSSLSIDNILSIDCLSKYCNNIFNILREPYPCTLPPPPRLPPPGRALDRNRRLRGPNTT